MAAALAANYNGREVSWWGGGAGIYRGFEVLVMQRQPAGGFSGGLQEGTVPERLGMGVIRVDVGVAFLHVGVSFLYVGVAFLTPNMQRARSSRQQL